MKITVYILVVALFLASLGTTLFYFPELGTIRENMQRRVGEEENQIELTFSSQIYADINWTNPGKEFRYHGEMYDVVSVRTVNGKVFISCLFDKKETSLRRELKDFFSTSSGKNSPLRHAVKVLAQKYVLGMPAFSLSSPAFLKIHFKPYHFIISDGRDIPETPPPEC